MKKARQMPLWEKLQRLEIHEHHFVSGPRSHKTWCWDFKHSHLGGNIPHQHPDTGPACYTIDKDEWLRATGGVKGGGRKQFTGKPSGEQMEWVELEECQKSFKIIVCDPPDPTGQGGADLAAARMMLAFRMRPIVCDQSGNPVEAA